MRGQENRDSKIERIVMSKRRKERKKNEERGKKGGRREGKKGKKVGEGREGGYFYTCP